MTQVELLTCPSCGAPLSVAIDARVAICHYCNCALRLSPTASTMSLVSMGPTMVTVDPTISTATVARIKQLILLGKRLDAVDVYQADAHCDRSTSESAIDAFAVDAVWNTLEAGRINAVGLLIYALAVVLLGGGITLGAMASVPWSISGSAALVGLAWMLFFGRRALRTLRYAGAASGTATVIRSAFIGQDARNDSLYRLLLDVHASSGATFRAEVPMVFGAAHAAAIREGHCLRVKYFPGAPTSVVYDGELS